MKDYIAKLSNPAATALIGYSLVLLTVLLPIDMYRYDEETQKYVRLPYKFLPRLVLALLIALSYVPHLYSINCMVVGKCMTWSWFLAGVSIVGSVLTVLVAFLLAKGGPPAMLRG